MNALSKYLSTLFSFDQAHPLLFTQFNFWAFFLLVYVVFCLIVTALASRPQARQGKQVWRNAYLFFVSLFFYYKTSGAFVLLLLFSTLTGYLLGILMDYLALRRSPLPDSEAAAAVLRTNRRIDAQRKVWMILGIIVNLAVLCYFKYAYFFTDIFNTITHSRFEVVNLLAQWANQCTRSTRFDASVIILPVGISFFTFQNISYIVDVYRQKVPHAGNILDFGFYTTFFPQLVAGPIVRADQFIPQLYKPYFLGRRQFGVAVFWIVNGLLKKIILSDYLAVSFVDRVFDNPVLYTPFENLSALFVYSLQVYADFSGYTDIAIGVAMLMGFYLPKNFNSPYKATNPAGFWKRWHMSLSNWLKDYLYIPIGGNRNATVTSYLILGGTLVAVALLAQTPWVSLAVGIVMALLVADYVLFPNHRKDFNTNINNLDTMLVGGLWHGASFNFITWGALNGMGIFTYKYWKRFGVWDRLITATIVFGLLFAARMLWPLPALNVFVVWAAVFFVGNVAMEIVKASPLGRLSRRSDTGQSNPILMVWNILMTFTFITFTRLFFRSGSNLDPREANQVAWQTARSMVNQMGQHWDLTQIPAIVENYSSVFILFVFGMVIHWLPERFKRRYRLWFALMPVWLMALVVVLAVLVVYQFITADLQPFIYFQF